MKLLTKDLKAILPPLYSTEKVEMELKKVVIKFFDPTGSWTWYAVEASAVTSSGDYIKLTDPKAADAEDVIFFGLVLGHEKEWGNFSLNELENYKGRLGLGIERDIHWSSDTLVSEI